MLDWIDDGGQFPGDCLLVHACIGRLRDVLALFAGGCGATGPVKTQLPMPNLATDCVDNNNAAALLMPDNRTLVWAE